MKRALISVSDKSGICELARGLGDCGFEIFSTGGTAKHLQADGIAVIDVAAYTGFPEMMDGRVKTLHPKIFGGILGRRDHQSDVDAMQKHDILTFDVLCVNLYPFAATVANLDVTVPEAVENIDIGGPSLIRAAAKNHPFVAVLTESSQYVQVLSEIQATGDTTLETRRLLMQQAFEHTASYDRMIADYFARIWAFESNDGLPNELSVRLTQHAELRHGENSHQLGAVYTDKRFVGPSVVTAKQLNGKQLSYNNFLDMDAALAIVRMQTEPACSVIKHNNPCGAAIALELQTAVAKAFAGDPQSAFGSVVAMNRTIDIATAQFLCETKNLFIEVIVAPGFDPAALRMLTTFPKWKTNVRLMEVGELTPITGGIEIRSIVGGAVVQSLDNQPDDRSQWKVVTDQKVEDAMLQELAFGWDMVRFVKSNAITLSKDLSLIGVGAGQMSRVDSVKIALEKAGDRAQGSVLASDAFFPFADSIPLAAAAGIAAIIQPGGSVKDDEVIAAANEHKIPMIFTQRRQFKH